jgi:hypothetical protein
MFKLPIKEIVINSASVVTEILSAAAGADPGDAGNIIKIEGFGEFVVPVTGTYGFKTVAVPAAVGVYDITPPADTAVAAGENWDLRLTFTQGPRVLSEIWSYGEKRTFQSGELAAATGVAWVDAMVAAQVVNPEYFGTENVLAFTNAAGKLRISFKPGYEGIGIALARTVEAFDIVGKETNLVITTVTEPNEGINLGKQIEAEVQNATYNNIDPYGIQLGGNAKGVDVRGLYTEVHWKASAPLNGFEPHEMTGYGDANTETQHEGTDQSAYINEGSAASAIALVELLVTGGPDPVV